MSGSATCGDNQAVLCVLPIISSRRTGKSVGDASEAGSRIGVGCVTSHDLTPEHLELSIFAAGAEPDIVPLCVSGSHFRYSGSYQD